MFAPVGRRFVSKCGAGAGRRPLVILLALLAGAMAPRCVHGADGPKKAVTNPADADADFPVQGEYAGWLRDPAGPASYFGLQVVALGEGRFDAWLFTGGLPGNGWNRQDRQLLKGQTVSGVTHCESLERKVEIRGLVAEVRDAAGASLGELHKVVRESRRQGAAPPPGAVVLFAGQPTTEITGAKISPEGWLEVGGITARAVRSFRLHLEFLEPYMPAARGQGRGNSGVYIQQRYEVQILDSFGLVSADNDCGSLYRQTPPDLNMSFPPLAWQTYDIEFQAARFDAQGAKLANARLTVYHNGIPIHFNREIPTKTGAGQKEGPEPRPILLQNHGDPVRFRNIWLVELHDAPAEPVATASCGLLRRLLACCRCRR